MFNAIGNQECQNYAVSTERNCQLRFYMEANVTNNLNTFSVIKIKFILIRGGLISQIHSSLDGSKPDLCAAFWTLVYPRGSYLMTPVCQSVHGSSLRGPTLNISETVH